jgi:hypothetical protein
LEPEPIRYGSLKYDSVVVREFVEHYDDKDSFKIFRVYKKAVVLNSKQAAKFIRIIDDHTTYGLGSPACFDPHMEVVYYKDGKALALVSICISCRLLHAWPDVKALHHYDYYGDGPVEDRITYTKEGFSDKGLKKMVDFCRQMGFEHCKNNYE